MVTASMGMARLDLDRDTPALARRADAALYEAKRAKRDTWLLAQAGT